MAYTQARRNELAREKGYRNYSDYRNAQSQAKGFANSYQEQKYRQEFGESLPSGGSPFGRLEDNPIWTSQVPPGLQDDPELQSWFRRGFLNPLRSHTHLTPSQKTARRNFINTVSDFDWDIWGEYADDNGGGETDIYAGT